MSLRGKGITLGGNSPYPYGNAAGRLLPPTGDKQQASYFSPLYTPGSKRGQRAAKAATCLLSRLVSAHRLSLELISLCRVVELALALEPGLNAMQTAWGSYLSVSSWTNVARDYSYSQTAYCTTNSLVQFSNLQPFPIHLSFLFVQCADAPALFKHHVPFLLGNLPLFPLLPYILPLTSSAPSNAWRGDNSGRQPRNPCGISGERRLRPTGETNSQPPKQVAFYCGVCPVGVCPVGVCPAMSSPPAAFFCIFNQTL